MDLTLFTGLIRNLFQVSAFYTDQKEEKTLRAFEERYCFHEKLQPMFTAHALSYLMDSMQDNTFYEIIDMMEVSLLFFRFADKTFFIGPYVKRQYEDQRMQYLLAENQVPASYALSLKLYYTALPMLGSYHIQNTVTACINSFLSANTEYSYHRLVGFHETMNISSLLPVESIDYSNIYSRYDRENHFLKMIETGNVENVLAAFDEVRVQKPSDSQMLAVNLYQNPMASLSIVRALARKAAENGGLSVIKIDEITQKAVQQMSASHHYMEQVNITNAMILELTQAVREQQKNLGCYSKAIAQVVSFLSDNYSQEIPLSFLAEMVHFSESHLSRAFKKETAFTISQYIANLRCKLAARMLKETDLPIQEISSHVGYPDSNYFVKVFKKQYGVTPSAYRCTE